jgi:predicted nuclease of restriction endonuclease-like RecB superfamily
MLTSDLAINWRRGNNIFPRFIKPDDESYLQDAGSLIEIFNDYVGETRGDLESELEEYVGSGTNYRILRGFIKLLFDRTEFDISSIAEPFEIRQKVFLKAREFQPILPDSKEREKVLKSVAKSYIVEKDEVLKNLYADLPAKQKLISFDEFSPEDLINRYNLAQAQAILYRCLEMKIWITPSNAANYRAVFGAIKHFGLIHSISGNQKRGYEITLTGAASLFNRSQKYGIQMAVFLPALLLCENWRFSAEISEKKGANLFYELSHENNKLNSCYFDDPEFDNPIIEKLKTDWEKSSTEWTLKENREVLDLGKTAFVPDFVLISPDKEKVFLDVMGFWTPKSLKKRLEEFEKTNFTKYIIAVSQELRGTREEMIFKSDNVIFFKSVIRPLLLEETAEKLL